MAMYTMVSTKRKRKTYDRLKLSSSEMAEKRLLKVSMSPRNSRAVNTWTPKPTAVLDSTHPSSFSKLEGKK